MLWLTRALSDIGRTQCQPVPDKKEGFVNKPYLRASPKLLLKDSQTPISLSFQFHCPEGSNCLSCGNPNPKSNKKLPPCLFSRRIIFVDSCLHLKSSLANCVSDLNNVAKQTNIPLSKMFPTTFAFATDVGYTSTQFQTLVSAKMQFPFSLCTSIASLKECTSVPSIEFFRDRLSNRTSVNQHSYDTFCHIWSTLGFSSLLDCLWVYSLADATMLLDAIQYHYIEIWLKTGLFPTFYLTGNN